jgi:hypothetical protein
MESAQFITLVVILLGHFYWTDRKLAEIRKEITEIKITLATMNQKLDDHITSHP